MMFIHHQNCIPQKNSCGKSDDFYGIYAGTESGAVSGIDETVSYRNGGLQEKSRRIGKTLSSM